MERNYDEVYRNAWQMSHNDGGRDAMVGGWQNSLVFEDLSARNQKKITKTEVNLHRRKANDGKTQFDKGLEAVGGVISLFNGGIPRLSSGAGQNTAKKDAEDAKRRAEEQELMYQQMLEAQNEKNAMLQQQMSANQLAQEKSAQNQKMMMFGALALVIVVMGGMFFMMNRKDKKK